MDVEIYNRWNSQLTVTANHGTATILNVFDEPVQLTLISCKYADDTLNIQRGYFAETLKCTTGWEGIKAAIDAAPFVELNAEQKMAKIEQAR